MARSMSGPAMTSWACRRFCSGDSSERGGPGDRDDTGDGGGSDKGSYDETRSDCVSVVKKDARVEF